MQGSLVVSTGSLPQVYDDGFICSTGANGKPMMRFVGRTTPAILLVSAATTSGLGGEPQRPPATPGYTDVAASSGLRFKHFPGVGGQYYIPEIMGSGCALFDYDNDGDLDVYLLQGNLVHPPGSGAGRPRNRLFRNDLISQGSSAGTLGFTDITDQTGTGDPGYAMGVATADYDNDGDVDLYVTNLGPDVLLRNNGDGTFSDVTTAAGVGDPRWTSSASFFDYDNDGFLDLVVLAYADFTLATHKQCSSYRGVPDYCGPAAFDALPDRLYRNLGDGTFQDVSEEAGIDKAYGHGLGVAAADFDDDGWMDLYVANDSDANQLWMNQGGRFTDAGLLSGAALNHAGAPEAGMGVAIGDPDDDGAADIFVTHLGHETNTFYRNLGGALFTDCTTILRLGLPSRPWTGFGVGWVDVDHDSDLDLFVVNGDVRAMESLPDDPYPYHQPNQLFIRNADGTFSQRPAEAGTALGLSEVSRGLAAGDVDNDGDIDLLINNNNGPARLLRSDLVAKNNWVLLRVIDAVTGRDAIGASLRFVLDDGRTLSRYVTTDGSYCSASDPRVHCAWPSEVRLRSVQVALPDGRTEAVEGLVPGTITTVRVGAGGTENGG